MLVNDKGYSINLTCSRTNLIAILESDLILKASKPTWFDCHESQKNNRNKIFPTVIITDGNQTSGNDYVYSFDSSNKVFPVVLGDTTKLLDLKINPTKCKQICLLQKQIPCRVFFCSIQETKTYPILQYHRNSVWSRKKSFVFINQKTAVINVLLPANKVGS
jgi:hypothetical protein